MHKAESFMQAMLTTLTAAMPTVTIGRDDVYLDELTTTDKINITQGDDVILNQNIQFIDSELTVNLDLTVVQQAAATPVGTLLNALRSAIVQALAPTTNSTNSLGVVGTYDLAEGDSFPPNADHVDRPVADLRMLWTVKIRRQIDNPELL